MLPDAVRQAILVRSLWMLASNPRLSREDARAQAAAEIAEEQRAQARYERRPTPAARPRDARDTLIARVLAVASRLAASRSASPPSPPDHRAVRLERAAAPTPPPSASTSRPRRSLGQRLASAFEPKPGPPEPEHPVYRAENSNAVLISDAEYAPRFRDGPTRNYRRSIEANERLYAEKHGYTKSRLVR
jgi:hypothetical protein